MPSPFSRQQALSFGWSRMKEHLPLFLHLTLVSWLLGSLQGAVARGGPMLGLRWLLSAALSACAALCAMMWIRAALRIHDGQRPEALAELLPDMGEFFSYLLAGAVYGLVVAVGLVLLIVPGLLWAAEYGLFPFLIVDRKLPPLQALKASAAMTEGRRGALLVFGLLLLGVNLLGALALGVGLLFTLPTSALAATYVYRRLAATAHEPEAMPVDHGDAATHASA